MAFGELLEGDRTHNLYEQIVAGARRRRWLLHVHWELTHRCNARCSHCYLDVQPPGARVTGELSTDECLQIIDQLADLGVASLTLSGGEILVRRDFFAIARHAHTKRFVLRLFTNGIGVTPRVADQIADLHPFSVEISLYGVDAATHESITQVPGSHAATLRALRRLRDRGVHTVIKTPLMHENVHEIQRLAALAEELGAGLRTDLTITTKLDGTCAPLRHRLTDEDLLWLLRKTLDPAQWPLAQLSRDAPTCGVGQLALLIDPYGDVCPCAEVRMVAGNVRSQPIAEIWRNSAVFATFGELTRNKLPICRTCSLASLCVRCHGIAMNEEGNVRRPALANCRIALARRQVLIEKGALPPDYPVPSHLLANLKSSVGRTELG
jgi:radical SAM protein with 4Fe4S-binding SPASM domain